MNVQAQKIKVLQESSWYCFTLDLGGKTCANQNFADKDPLQKSLASDGLLNFPRLWFRVVLFMQMMGL